MIEQKKKILTSALGMFNRYGFKSVTMDDLATDMCISKKTLYKFFQNKADLVDHCGQMIFRKIQEKLQDVHKNSESAIDELFEVDKVVWEMIEKQNPSMHFQIQKYYPKTFERIFYDRQIMIRKMVADNIERGKKDGCFRKDADTEVISHLYCSKMEAIPDTVMDQMDHQKMRYFSLQALVYHIRGLATEQGLARLEEKLKTYHT